MIDSPSAAKKKILIADDEELVRNALRRILRSEPYDLLCAVDGLEAMRTAATLRPDLILLDIHMPGADGWRVLETLRRDSMTRLIPVIVLTGAQEGADKVAGLERGAADFVTKPFDVLELKARISSTLTRHQMDLAANPLTGLPGSPAIEEEARRRIGERTPFALLYVDIDRFKAYNDRFGFARGNALIRLTAEVLTECLRESDDAEGFAGHVGGDDFVLLAAPGKSAALATAIAHSFDRKTSLPADPEDAAASPGPSLSIGVAGAAGRTFESFEDAAREASEMKRLCKEAPPTSSSRIAL